MDHEERLNYFIESRTKGSKNLKRLLEQNKIDFELEESNFNGTLKVTYNDSIGFFDKLFLPVYLGAGSFEKKGNSYCQNVVLPSKCNIVKFPSESLDRMSKISRKEAKANYENLEKQLSR